MPTLHKALPLPAATFSPQELNHFISEARHARRTRFIADENIEPWALYILRYKRFDVIDSDTAGTRGRDDHAVFAKAWRLKRVLVTHDEDFLDDRRFPFFRCAGLVVFPTFPRQSRNYAALLEGALNLIRRGDRMWFHTKIIVGRDFKVIVRTWEKSEGQMRTFVMDAT